MNLGNLEKAIFMKSQGRPGIIREISVIFIQVRESQGKSCFGNSLAQDLCKAVPKVVVPFAVCICKPYHFTKRFHFLCQLLKICEMGVRKKVYVLNYKSGKGQVIVKKI